MFQLSNHYYTIGNVILYHLAKRLTNFQKDHSNLTMSTFYIYIPVRFELCQNGRDHSAERIIIKVHFKSSNYLKRHRQPRLV